MTTFDKEIATWRAYINNDLAFLERQRVSRMLEEDNTYAEAFNEFAVSYIADKILKKKKLEGLKRHDVSPVLNQPFLINFLNNVNYTFLITDIVLILLLILFNNHQQENNNFSDPEKNSKNMAYVPPSEQTIKSPPPLAKLDERKDSKVILKREEILNEVIIISDNTRGKGSINGFETSLKLLFMNGEYKKVIELTDTTQELGEGLFYRALSYFRLSTMPEGKLIQQNMNDREALLKSAIKIFKELSSPDSNWPKEAKWNQMVLLYYSNQQDREVKDSIKSLIINLKTLYKNEKHNMDILNAIEQEI